MEARREKLLVTIERAERTFEKHDKAAKRWLKRLAVLNGTKRRADKAIAKAKAEAADALVESTAPNIGKLYADASAAKPRTLSERTDAIVSNMLQGKSFEEAAAKDDGLDIPPALDRTRKLQAMADPKTKEKKAERRKVEAEHRQAELTGKRRKMPPTGKAAVDMIKNGA
jgi:hypothetical protein